MIFRLIITTVIIHYYINLFKVTTCTKYNALKHDKQTFKTECILTLVTIIYKKILCITLYIMNTWVIHKGFKYSVTKKVKCFKIESFKSSLGNKY